MKKVLIICSLLMLGFVSQSYAATFNLGMISSSKSFDNNFGTNEEKDEPFTDVFKFTTPDNIAGIAISATNVSINLGDILKIGEIKDFKAKLNGVALNFDQQGAGVAVAKLLLGAFPVDQNEHKLTVSGIVPVGVKSAAYGGSITVTEREVPAVPVPAAVWLFGSALLGLMGVQRSKKA